MLCDMCQHRIYVEKHIPPQMGRRGPQPKQVCSSTAQRLPALSYCKKAGLYLVDVRRKLTHVELPCSMFQRARKPAPLFRSINTDDMCCCHEAC